MLLQFIVVVVVCFLVQMSPTKHFAFKKSSKHPHTDSDNFKSIEANMAYNNATNKPQSLWKIVRMETLKDTCIPNVFKERTWTKLLNPSGNVYAEIIKEFFSNASVDGDHINC